MNRLQQVVISLLMGYFFVRTVYNSVAMPVWTDNQILLLAVSSATYLGLEWQNNRTRDTATPTDGSPAPVPSPASMVFAAPVVTALPATGASTPATSSAVSAEATTTIDTPTAAGATSTTAPAAAMLMA